MNTGLSFLNDGSYNNDPDQLGVRGRVGFGDGDDGVRLGNYIYQHDPFTNEIVGWYDFTDNLLAKNTWKTRSLPKEHGNWLLKGSGSMTSSGLQREGRTRLTWPIKWQLNLRDSGLNRYVSI